MGSSSHVAIVTVLCVLGLGFQWCAAIPASNSVRFGNNLGFISSPLSGSARISNNVGLRRENSPKFAVGKRHVRKLHASSRMQEVAVPDQLLDWVTLPDFVLQAPISLWLSYESALEQHPQAIDAITGVVLYLLGTLVSGWVTKSNVPPERLLRWMIFGTMDGLLTHEWYQAIDAAGDFFGSGWEKVAFMISSDTLVYTPTYCLVFIVVMALLEGRGLADAAQQVRTDIKELTQASVSAWLPFNTIIYGFVPLRFRLAAAMMVHFIYAIGLALWEIGFFGTRGALPAEAGLELKEERIAAPAMVGNYTTVG